MNRRLTSTLIACALVAGCSRKVVGPQPSLQAVTPAAACDDQLSTSIALSGAGMSALNDQLLMNPKLVLPQLTLEPKLNPAGETATSPAITIPDNPREPALSDVTWTSQQAMSFTVCPPGTCSPAHTDLAALPAAGLYSLKLSNTNGNTATLDSALVLVDPPVLDSVVADLLCEDQENQVTLHGDNFYQLNGQTVTVSVGSQTYTPTLSDCRSLPAPSGLQLQACKTAQITIAAGTFMPGTQPVKVTGPVPIGCHSTKSVTITFVPEPTLAKVQPDLVCDAQENRTLTLTGTGFLTVDSAMPQVMLGMSTFPAATATDCQPVTGPSEVVQSCKTLTVTVPQGSLPAGNADVVVQNPPPADCKTHPALNLTVMPPPTLTSVQPTPICTAQGTVPLNLTGTGFVTVNGTVPTITLTDMAMGSMPVVFNTGITAVGCESVAGPSETVQTCTGLTLQVPKDSLTTSDTYAVQVQNPDPVGCVSMEAVDLHVSPPPQISQVEPQTICHGGGTLNLAGMNFAPGATITVGPLTSPSVSVSADGTSATASVGAGLTPGNLYQVTLSNGDGCSATAAMEVNVVTGPIAFFADPPTVWNGATTQITVYGANIQPPIKGVQIAPTGGAMGAKDLTFTTDPNHPNRARAIVPSGTAAGTYDVIMQDQSGCPAILIGGLQVVQTTTVAITSVNPASGYINANTAVQINSSGAFQATPRVYLTPASGGTNPATALASVSFTDSSTLSAVVPADTLSAGQYTLIVVNPDGSVGVLPDAYKAVTHPTPLVTTLNPGVISTQTNQSFQVVGQNFAANAQVTLSCVDQNGAPMTAPSLNAGSPTSCTFNGLAQTCIAVTIPSPGSSGACVVTVTNPDDSARFDFSSLVIQNPSLKLGNFQPAKPMTTGRRAPALVTAQATPAARFVYAIGGDTGTENTALDTVEATPVDVFGKMGTWFPLPPRMTTKRTFVGAVAIGRFLYAIGGSDGTQALKTVERAAVLDPTNVPQFSDLDIAEGNGMGLEPGLYSYRVAPIMDPNDPFNPGGEGLASDAFLVQAPNLSDKAQLTLTWKPFDGAVKYRVYRTPTANLPAGQEVLIADNVLGTTLVDNGLSPMMVDGSTVPPLPQGCTGVWKTVASMGTARSGAAVTTIADLSDPTVNYIYALGGNPSTEALPLPTSTTEFLKLQIQDNGSQSTQSSWTAGPSLNTPKWQAGGYALTIGGTNYVWAGGGRSTLTLTGNVDGAAIGSSGLPGAFTTLGHTMNTRAGYAAIGVNGFLFALGGAGGSPDTAGVQGQVSSPPQVTNWPFSTSLSTARYLTASTVQSGFIFVCGGQTNSSTADTSCETTIW